MGTVFSIDGRNIEVSDKAASLFRKKMGFNLTSSLVRSRIGIVYGGDPFHGIEGQSRDEAMKTHTDAEIGAAVSEAFIQEMNDDYK